MSGEQPGDNTNVLSAFSSLLETSPKSDEEQVIDFNVDESSQLNIPVEEILNSSNVTLHIVRESVQTRITDIESHIFTLNENTTLELGKAARARKELE